MQVIQNRREDIFEKKFSDLLLESILHWALAPNNKQWVDKYWLIRKKHVPEGEKFSVHVCLILYYS